MPRTLLLLALLMLARPALSGADALRLNVLFFFADDQRADTIAALGNPVIHTPGLDRLVRRGVSFHRAYLQGSLNAATCIPSRAMLLSGRGLFGVDEHLMTHETWPAAFARAGYRTFIAGKWHNGIPSLLKSFQEGRAIFVGGMGNPMEVPLWDIADGKLERAPANTKGTHACERMADAAIAFLQQESPLPFLCYVPFDAPHDPHIVPEDFPVRYDPATIPLPPNFRDRHPFDNGELTIRDERLLPWPRPPASVRAMIADYYRYISYLDHQIGRVLDALAASPHAHSTIVVFSSDSGVARGSHGLIGKQNLYEHSVRVPLIIAAPGLAANTSTDALCYLFDLFPTLGKLCGVPAPADNEGTDLSAVLQNPAAAGRSHLLFAYKNVQRGIVRENWKLLHYPYANQIQLFDLQLDPTEERNVAGEASNAPLVGELQALLRAELEKLGDPAPPVGDNNTFQKSGEESR